MAQAMTQTITDAPEDVATSILSYIQADYLWEYRNDHLDCFDLTEEEQEKCISLVYQALSHGIIAIEAGEIV